MRLQIPVVKRCCFCWPIRHGLLAWGCFKMIADGILITILTISLTRTVMTIKSLGPYDNILSMISDVDLVIPVTVLAVLIVDFLGTIMFIFGGREKNMHLTQLFYFISIAMWIITLIVTTVNVVIILQSDIESSMAAFSFCFLNVVIQTYFLIVLRSQIIKLRNSEESPQDKTAEAECTKQYDDIVVEEEIGKEDV